MNDDITSPPVFKHEDSQVGLLDDETIVLQPINSNKLFKFTWKPSFARGLLKYRWHHHVRGRANYLIGFDRNNPTRAVRMEQAFLGPLPWTSKLVFKNGDKQDYRDENLELVPLKTPRVSW